MRKPTSALAISVVTALSAPLAAQENNIPVSPVALALIDEERIHTPQAAWSLTSAGDGCSVQREFMLDGNHITFVMKRLQPGMPLEYALVGGGFDPEEELQAGFVPGTGLANFSRIGTASAGNRDGVFFAGPAFPRVDGHYADELSLSTATRYFVVQDGDDHAVVLRTGAVRMAIDALTQCADEQLAALGVRPRGASEGGQPLRLLNATEIGTMISRPYSRLARVRKVSGEMPIRVVVNGSGTMVDCQAGDGLIPRALREEVCTIMREQGEYEIAVDGDGQTVVGVFFTNIIFSSLGMTPGADGRVYRERD